MPFTLPTRLWDKAKGVVVVISKWEKGRKKIKTYKNYNSHVRTDVKTN